MNSIEEKAAAFIGKILNVNGSELTVFAGSEQKKVPIFTNTRIAMTPKKGDTALFIRVEGGYVCIGMLQR